MAKSDVRVSLLNPTVVMKGRKGILASIKLIRELNRIGADVVYLNLLMGISDLQIARALGFLNSKIIGWKYTYCLSFSNPFFNYLTRKFYWKGVDYCFMMFENHTNDALKKHIIEPEKIETLTRGCEVEWYRKFTSGEQEKGEFSVIATGKDNRDYETLCKACEDTKTKLRIFTRKHSNCVIVAKKYTDSEYVDFVFMEDLNISTSEEYEYINHQMSKASVLAICCEKRPYGVGYSNVVDGLSFGIPILMTTNPDCHIDTEKEGIGYMIQPYDVESWKKRILQLKNNKEICNRMSVNIQKLINFEYNSQTTANRIYQVMTK